MLDSLTALNPFLVAELEVGSHLYWEIGGLQVHGQVLLSTWLVIAILLTLSFLASRNVQMVPSGMQNLMEYMLIVLEI